MKRIKFIILTLGLIGSLSLAIPQSIVGATPDVFGDACSGDAANTAICKNRQNEQIPSFAKKLVNLMLYVLGAVSVVVIIFAGIFYTTSLGDSAAITKAKNTLLYAVVGLVVAMLAYAIVNFVLINLK
jgi:hypothetical protein